MEGLWAVGNECEGEQGIFIPGSHHYRRLGGGVQGPRGPVLPRAPLSLWRRLTVTIATATAAPEGHTFAVAAA